VALALSWFTRGSDPADSTPARRLAVPLTVRPSLPAVGPVAAISPDAERLVFRGASATGEQLFVHELDTGVTRPLPGTSDAISPRAASPASDRPQLVHRAGAAHVGRLNASVKDLSASMPDFRRFCPSATFCAPLNIATWHILPPG
jgi:hypothetical protein